MSRKGHNTKTRRRNKTLNTAAVLIIALFVMIGEHFWNNPGSKNPISLDAIPAYSGTAAIVINNNQPFFKEKDLTEKAFEKYSSLDSLGRSGVAYANICKDTMPTTQRGEIGAVHPSGWHTVKYTDRIDGNYLFNRCHLIGYQLAGENANEKNLITGTRYMNVTGMESYENLVAKYVRYKKGHVLYRVTPIYEGKNLVASGVLMEAESVEDKGEGIRFCVYCYNVEPGVIIDYKSGTSKQDTSYQGESQGGQLEEAMNAGSFRDRSWDRYNK